MRPGRQRRAARRGGPWRLAGGVGLDVKFRQRGRPAQDRGNVRSVQRFGVETAPGEGGPQQQLRRLPVRRGSGSAESRTAATRQLAGRGSAAVKTVMEPSGSMRFKAEVAPQVGNGGDLGTRPWRLVEASAEEADASDDGGSLGWLGGGLERLDARRRRPAGSQGETAQGGNGRR